MKYTAAQYAKGLRELAAESPERERRSLLRSFLCVLETHNALSLVSDIEREYELFKAAEQGIREVSIRAPERESESVLRRKLPFKAHLEVFRDVRLRGGVVIQSGDIRIDNSIAMRLHRIKSALAE